MKRLSFTLFDRAQVAHEAGCTELANNLKDDACRASELEKDLSAWERGISCKHCLRCGDDGKCNCGFSPLYTPLICNCYKPDGTWQHPAYEIAGETEEEAK